MNSRSRPSSSAAQLWSAVRTVARSRRASARHARSPRERPCVRVDRRSSPAAIARPSSKGRMASPKPRSDSRASSSLAPRSTRRATTSDALTADSTPSPRASAARSAPCSPKAIASTAELSKTTDTIGLPTSPCGPRERRQPRLFPVAGGDATSFASVGLRRDARSPGVRPLPPGQSPADPCRGASPRASPAGSPASRQGLQTEIGFRHCAGPRLEPLAHWWRRSLFSNADTAYSLCPGCHFP